MADMQLCILASVLRRSHVRRTMLIVVNPIACMPRASVLLCVLDVLATESALNWPRRIGRDTPQRRQARRSTSPESG
jgi:hypothetical protein